MCLRDIGRRVEGGVEGSTEEKICVRVDVREICSFSHQTKIWGLKFIS